MIYYAFNSICSFIVVCIILCLLCFFFHFDIELIKLFFIAFLMEKCCVDPFFSRIYLFCVFISLLLLLQSFVEFLTPPFLPLFPNVFNL